MSAKKDSDKIDIRVGVDSPVDQGVEAEEKTQADLLAKLQAEKQELLDTLVRRQADFENYRKRIDRDRLQENRRAVTALVESLLPVLDAFDRAIAAHEDPAYEEYRKGVELIRRQLWDVLAKQGLARIQAVGKPFDPHMHHAIERIESSTHPEGTVMEELQAGYMLHEKVLRPAMVRVTSQPSRAASAADALEN